MDAAFGAFGQRLFDGLLGALRPHGNGHDFAAMLFLQAQRFFEREAIGLVRFKPDVGFANPARAFGKAERRILRGNLLNANANFQGRLRQHCMDRIGLQRILSAILPALEQQRSIRAAEAKGIRERVDHFGFARFVGNVIQIARGIGLFVIDRRRKNLIAQREHADARFKSARAAQQDARSWISSS